MVNDVYLDNFLNFFELCLSSEFTLCSPSEVTVLRLVYAVLMRGDAICEGLKSRIRKWQVPLCLTSLCTRNYSLLKNQLPASHIRLHDGDN